MHVNLGCPKCIEDDLQFPAKRFVYDERLLVLVDHRGYLGLAKRLVALVPLGSDLLFGHFEGASKLVAVGDELVLG